MASRDRTTLTMECPKCGHSGRAEVSENDYPFMRHPGFSVDEAPDGFKVVKIDNFQHGTKVQCKCGETFNL